VIPGDDRGLVAKTVLDQVRTTAGVAKVVLSAGLLAAAALAMALAAEWVLGVTPSYPVVLGATVGLTGFTTYNWLTVFDDPEDYLTLPLDAADLYWAKLRTFLLLGVPLGVGWYLLALVPVGADPGPAIVGAILVVGTGLFVLGLTVRLAGFAADEFLFDGVVFAAFSLGVVVVLVPVLSVGLAVSAPATATLVALALYGVGAGATGVALFRSRIVATRR